MELIVLLASAVNIFLGLYVLLKGPQRLVNRLFSYFCVLIGIWCLVNLLMGLTQSIFMVKLTYGIAAMLPNCALIWILCFCEGCEDKRKFVLIFLFCVPFVAGSLVDGWIVKRVDKVYLGTFEGEMGWAFPIYSLYMFSMVSYTFYVLVKNYLSKQGLKRLHIKYILIGASSFAVVSLLVGIFLPLLGILKFSFLDTPSTLLFTCFSAYAIVKYRLMEIEVFIKKSGLIALVGGIALTSILTFLSFFQYHFPLYGLKIWMVGLVFLTIMATSGFFYLFGLIIKTREKEELNDFLYKDEDVLLKFGDFKVCKDLNEFLRELSVKLFDYFNVTYLECLVWSHIKKNFVLKENLGNAESTFPIHERIMIGKESPLILYFRQEKRGAYGFKSLYKDFVKELQKNDKSLSELFSVLVRSDIKICIPIVYNNELLGIVFLGGDMHLVEPLSDKEVDMLKRLGFCIGREVNKFLINEEKVCLIIESKESIIRVIEAKSDYTKGHTRRVAQYCILVSEGLKDQLKFIPNALSNLYWCALLHDAGKIGLPDEILEKPSELTWKEWSKIREHPLKGLEIIADLREWLEDDIFTGILQHHENFNGTGYPSGKQFGEIHIFARIIRVADALDAMTSKRPYRAPLSLQEAMEELSRGSGKDFDPSVVDAFKRSFRENPNAFAKIVNLSSTAKSQDLEVLF